MRKFSIPILLSFNGGFVDAAGFLALQGLFTSHVTGNFVTLGAALVSGTHGIFAKVAALPEFIIVIVIARVLGSVFRKKGLDALWLLLLIETLLLLAFFLLAVTLGPFVDSDAPAALLVGFTGVAAMAIQNAVQRVHFASIPPTTIMTGNTTQAVLDAVDLWRNDADRDRAIVKARFALTVRAIVCFALGCGAAAAAYFWTDLWCLALPPLVAMLIAMSSRGYNPAASEFTPVK